MAGHCSCLVIAIGVGAGRAEAAIPAPELCVAGAGAPCWDPEPTTEPWQWQLQGRIDLTVPAPVYDVDMDVDAGVVDSIHAQGDRAICYLSVGTHEPFRSDADRFPKRVLGERLDRFASERWLDIRKIGVLRPIMEARLRRVRPQGLRRGRARQRRRLPESLAGSR